MLLLHVPASGKATPANDLGEYAKKAYLFDTTAEFHFFTVLEELVVSVIVCSRR